MGSWNTGILENDDAMDVYGFFERLYNKQQLDIEEIKTETLSHFNLINEEGQPVFGSNEWLAYAQICWECKALDEKTINVVNEILQDKAGIKEDWEDLADKRISDIEKFFIKIQQAPKRKKAIKKQYIVSIPFQQGDCILVKTKDEMYSVVILLDIDQGNEEQNMWTYWVGTTRIYQGMKPTLDDVINSHFLVVNYGKTFEGEKAIYINKPKLWISGCFNGTIKNEKDKEEKENSISQYEVIGNLKIGSNPNNTESYGSFWLDNSFQLKSQKEWEKEHPDSIDFSYPIRNYIETEQPLKK